MKPKISVIIPCGLKHNETELEYWKKLLKEVRRKRHLFTTEFPHLYEDAILNADSVIDFTLKSLEWQSFKEFEIIFVSKYPDEMLPFIEKYKLPIKVVQDKPTLWHKLDRFALQNARNTGIIHAKGELLFFIDPYQIFNRDILQEAWDAWEFRREYLTFQHITKIYYGATDELIQNWRHFHKGWRKVLTRGKWVAMLNMPGMDKMPNNQTWGYGFTVSLADTLKINGFDEIYDGNYGSDDGEFGHRLQIASSRNRFCSKNIMYELAYEYPMQISWDKLPRDNSILFFNYTTKQKNFIANKFKPDKSFLDRYPKIYRKKWNKELTDKNWDKFMEVPTFNIIDERNKEEKLGKVILDRMR